MSENVEKDLGRALPPPHLERGAVGWVRVNLFNSKFNAALTVLAGTVVVLALSFAVKWILFDADWTVIGTLGGRMIIGQYNNEIACPSLNCFWRPQAALLLVTVLLGMGWGIAGSGLAKRLAIGIAAVLAAFALLPYSMEQMGLDVRLLLIANLPAVGLGWLIARYTPLGSMKRAMISAAVVFVVTLLLLRGIEGIPGLGPVSVIYWGRADVEPDSGRWGHRGEPSHRHSARLGAAEQASRGEAAVRSVHRSVPRSSADSACCSCPRRWRRWLSRRPSR